MVPLSIDKLVRERLGLDPESLGQSALPRAVAIRMKATGAVNAEAYAASLESRAAELDALGLELVVAETWFFRGGAALFDQLVEFVERRAPGNPVRILSLPCSSGEEPYSLAIALHERRVPPESYRIDGVDFSAEHLKRARAGRYSSFSFRESGVDIRPANFHPVERQWELRESIRRSVRFRQGNAADANFLHDEPAYDLIICRNLFIYLTPDAKRRVFENLDRLLAHDGLICLTPAEADRLPPGKFTSASPNNLGLYKREELGSVSPPVVKPIRPTLRTATPQPPIPTVHPARPAPSPTRLAEAPAQHPLERARSQADDGDLAAAMRECKQFLTLNPESADAHSLLGIIHMAEGRLTEASEAFRRALYLDPDHADAIGHMILICEQRGDKAQAATFRKRLQRASREEMA